MVARESTCRDGFKMYVWSRDVHKFYVRKLVSQQHQRQTKTRISAYDTITTVETRIKTVDFHGLKSEALSSGSLHRVCITCGIISANGCLLTSPALRRQLQQHFFLKA